MTDPFQTLLGDAAAGSKSVIVYDGDCPVCSRFFPRYLRILRSGHQVVLLNARGRPDVFVWLLKNYAIDLDRDAAVYIDRRWYAGAAGLITLYVTARSRGRLQQNVVRIAIKFLYPPLRLGRRLLLFVLGRSLLRPSTSDRRVVTK